MLQILTGHQDNAEFALAMCPTEPFVLSGGGISFNIVLLMIHMVQCVMNLYYMCGSFNAS